MNNDNHKDQVRQTFASRFRKALAELGYTPTEQKALSKLFGVSGQAVRKWADGESMPTPSRMPRVAAVLGVRRAWLQDGEDPMRPLIPRISESSNDYDKKSGSDFSLSGKELRLLLQFRALKPKQKSLVQKLIALLVESTRGE